MIFNYTYIENGVEKEATVEAGNRDVAIKKIQGDGTVLVSIEEQKKKGLGSRDLTIFGFISQRDLVIFSRQIATLFKANVSPIQVFSMLADEADNLNLQKILDQVTEDIRGGQSMSDALKRHSKVFSPFYVNMVRAGEETGKLPETFEHLANYLDRSYQMTSKVKNALIYPVFVIITFVGVLTLMLRVVIPRLSSILTETGQELPLYTKIVLNMSDFVVNFGFIVFVFLVIGGVFMWRYIKTEKGGYQFDQFRLNLPVIGGLYRKLFLTRIADNVSTMLTSGVSMVRSLENTAAVVGNGVYEKMLDDVTMLVRSGSSLADAMGRHPQFPSIMVQMVRVGEETGELGSILETLAKFYEREVQNSVETMISLIEPAMIVTLGLGVGFLLAAVLVPIYNIASGIA